jgi:hypothetical protein
MSLPDNSDFLEDTSLREAVTRIAIVLVALVVLSALSFFSLDPRHATRTTLMAFVFVAGFSAVIVFTRLEMGRRRFWLVGALVAFAALVVGLL